MYVYAQTQGSDRKNSNATTTNKFEKVWFVTDFSVIFVVCMCGVQEMGFLFPIYRPTDR